MRLIWSGIFKSALPLERAPGRVLARSDQQWIEGGTSNGQEYNRCDFCCRYEREVKAGRLIVRESQNWNETGRLCWIQLKIPQASVGLQTPVALVCALVGSLNWREALYDSDAWVFSPRSTAYLTTCTHISHVLSLWWTECSPHLTCIWTCSGTGLDMVVLLSIHLVLHFL